MNRKPGIWLLVLLVLLLFSLADTDIGGICLADEDCLDPQNAEGCTMESCYCNFESNTCFLRDNTTAANETAGAETAALQQRLAELETRQATVANVSLSQQGRIEAVEMATTALQQQISQQTTAVQDLQQRVGQLEQAAQQTQQRQNTLATGLAGLQEGLGVTKEEVDNLEEGLAKEQSFTRLIKIVFFSLLAITVALVVIYFITNKRTQPVDPAVREYITSHIRKGHKFPEIKQHLLQAGWGSMDIEKAYKQTLQRNYQTYKQRSTGKSSNNDTLKAVMISVFSVLLLVGAFFVFRGITAGKAVAIFQSEEELKASVSSLLDTLIDENEFYPLVTFASFCVEVHDGPHTAAFKVIKTPRGHLVQEAPTYCHADSSYDGAVMFSTWNSFNVVLRNMDCGTFERQHGNYYVLPSKYVLPGFILNPAEDATPFCAALSQCLSAAQSEQIGLAC